MATQQRKTHIIWGAYRQGMGRKRRLRLRRAGSGGMGGSGRKGGAGQDGAAPAAGRVDLAGRFGLRGEPDYYKVEVMVELVDRIRRDIMRPDFDRDAYVESMRAQGIPEEAVDLVDEAIAMNADKKMCASIAVMDAIKGGRLDEAKRLIEEAERRYGCDESASRYDVLDYEGKFEEILVLCDKRIASDRTDTYWINAKADALNQMGRAEEQLELYENARKSVRGTPGWLAGRARALVAVGRLNEAEQIAVRLAESEERPDTACVALGEILMARGDPKGAIKLFNRVLDMDKFDDRGFVGKANALAALGRHKEAVEVCDILLNDAPIRGRLKRTRDRIISLMDDK